MAGRKLRKDADPARKAAKEAGETHYISSRPCTNGHPAGLRRTINNKCIECEKAATVGGQGKARKNANVAQIAAKEAGERFYFTGEPCEKGHISQRYTSDAKCKQCVSERNKAKRDSDPEFRDRAKQRHREWREQNPELALANSREWYEENKERHLTNTKAWVKENPDARRAIQRRYDHSVAHLPEVRKHKALKTQMRKKRVTTAQPDWADKGALWQIYADRPEGMTVDHIVPLLGTDPVTGERNVCGLHVPWNLQYLTQPENSAKQHWWTDEDSLSAHAIAL